jgi:hypothetical protein
MRVGQGHAAAKAQRVELQCLACSDRAADGRLAEPVVVLRDLITPVPMTAAPMVASVIASVPSLTMVPAPETVPAARQLRALGFPVPPALACRTIAHEQGGQVVPAF